jgi:hypothetical protein
MLFKYLPGASGLRGLLSRRGWSGWSGSTDIRREASPTRIHLDSMRIRRLVPSAITFNRRKHGLVAEVHSGERSELVSRPMLLLRRR